MLFPRVLFYMSGPGKIDNLYFKDNIHLIDQGSAKLASILAAINGSITSPARGKSIIIIKMHYCFQSSMAIFHRYLFQHLQTIAVSVRMLVMLPLTLSNLLTRRNSLSAVVLVRKILLLVVVTLTFVATVALWHLIIVISMSTFDIIVFCLVVDLAGIPFFARV